MNLETESLDDIGLLLRKARQARNLSLTDVAEKANMEKSNLSAIEHGRRSCGKRMLLKILSTLGYGVEIKLVPKRKHELPPTGV